MISRWKHLRCNEIFHCHVLLPEDIWLEMIQISCLAMTEIAGCISRSLWGLFVGALWSHARVDCTIWQGVDNSAKVLTSGLQKSSKMPNLYPKLMPALTDLWSMTHRTTMSHIVIVCYSYQPLFPWHWWHCDPRSSCRCWDLEWHKDEQPGRFVLWRFRSGTWSLNDRCFFLAENQLKDGLVGGLEHFSFSHILGMIIPID